MTNTLHRYGDAESFLDDYIVFASPSRGKNDEGSIPKLKKFLEMALPFKPVNIGDPTHGGDLRPSKNETILSHWHRDVQPRLRAVIDGIDEPASVAAVFDNLEAAENFLKTVKEADLGLSVNISASIEGARKCCRFAGIEPHSIGYSLGFEGKIEKLPNTQILALTTMCGHGMISSSLGKKMIDWVKEGRRTPEERLHTWHASVPAESSTRHAPSVSLKMRARKWNEAFACPLQGPDGFARLFSRFRCFFDPRSFSSCGSH